MTMLLDRTSPGKPLWMDKSLQTFGNKFAV
jgi:hypothetical protein